jgi:DNA replication protein DnaC
LISSTFQQGGNTALLMYGEPGSGKTYSLVGAGSLRSLQQHPDKRGLIVRAAEDLFCMYNNTFILFESFL